MYDEIKEIDVFYLIITYIFPQKTFADVATQTDPYIIQNYIKVEQDS